MLSDQLIQLLTAYVDGELSQRQRKAVGRLLQRSPEARTLLAQLYDDAQKLRQMPRHKAQPTLAPQVLQAISRQGLVIQRPAAAAARRTWRPYAAVALAASVVVALIGGAVYLALDQRGATVKDHNAPVIAHTPPAAKKSVAEKTAPERESPLPRVPNPLIAQVTEGVYSQYAAPLPPERPRDMAFAFRDLKDGRTVENLAALLNQDRAVQLDITVKNNPVALERLQRALDENGIKVVVDPQAQRAMKQNPAKGDVLVFAENLRTDELTNILRELSKDDKALQKFAKSPFEKAKVAPLSAAEKKQLSGLLGVQPAKVEPPENKKVEGAGPQFKRWERQAVVLPPTVPARPSAVVQGFASQRRPQPGTLQVLVRIHQEK